MKRLKYLGNSGTVARNDAGAWTAPDLPATPDAPNERDVESDALADALLASGQFAEVLPERRTSRQVLADERAARDAGTEEPKS